MRIYTVAITVFLLVIQSVSSQNKQITLEDIWVNNTFRAKRLQSIHSMKSGTEYAVQNFDKEKGSYSVDIYSYTTGEKVSTAVSTEDIDGLSSFRSYEFSQDEKKVLLATKLESIFRRSTLGEYYVWNTLSRKLTKVAKDLIQEPTFSPDGTQVAYGQNNNLYVFDIASETTTQITFDGQKNSIINGITDWVYEEEFGFVRAFDWSVDGKKIAYIRFDETEVPEFSMDVYGKELYQTQSVFKYPKAGEANAKVTLRMHNLETGNSRRAKDLEVYLGDNAGYYIPRITWTKDPNILAVQTLNRHQDSLKLSLVDARTNTATLAHLETDRAYVNVTNDLTFLEDNSFIWTSEKDGWNHIYHHNADGSIKNQVTSGDWEVTRYYGYDAVSKRIFYQSSENGSINRGVYAVGLNGKKKQVLAANEGTNSADFSADFTYFIHTFSNTTTPYRFTLNDAKDGKQIRVIEDNKKLKEVYASYSISQKQFFEIEVNGVTLNAYMIMPTNFVLTKKYPLFMTQYSGPGSQSVANKWGTSNDYWYQMLAQNDYMVVCVDPRGTGLKGRDFKKMTQKELGKYEVQDQIAAAKQMSDRMYVDEDRTGIWGWSYGGFMASNCLFQGADTFEMAIAVAPVTSWRFYDTIYTERYMQTPQENASGYDNNSPMSHVDKLKGDFLLVHGGADDNVHVQNSTRLVEALVQANKQFEYFNYPDKNHSIYGGNTRLHLYTMMTEFIKENL